jgi:hypothetical protein
MIRWGGVREGQKALWHPAKIIEGMSESPLIPYRDLAAIADRLFEESGDDEERLSAALDRVAPDVRSQLLISDLLNAYQVFYYFFRETPDPEVFERLILESASGLTSGIFLDEIDLFELIFRLESGEPVIAITDGEAVLAVFRGTGAYRQGLAYTESVL